MTQKELITLVERCAERNRQMAESLADSDNPQCVEMRHRCQGSYNAYIGVLDALKRNDKYMLQVDSVGVLI